MSGVAKLTIPTALYAVSNEYTYSNLSASNALTTSNILTMNATVSGSMFISGSSTVGSLTLGVTGNIYASNAITATNIFSATAVFTGPVRVDSNIYSSNDMIFAGLFEKTTIDVTGNASVSNAITTTNVWTSNIYASGKLSFAGLPNLTTLAASNLSVSNTILTTNVWTSNLISPGDITITGAVSTGITTLQVTGNTMVSHTVTSGNVYASGNIYVTADSQSVTGNIFMANALVTANLWATTSVYAGVGAYVDKTVILTDPTLGALAATVYTGAGQGTIVRTGHMPMHPTLTTAPSGVWAGDTYFDTSFLNKYITSTWRPIELLYPTAVPVIGSISNQVGQGPGQMVVVVTQTATPFSSLGTVLWTISGAPTGTVIEGGSNSGCFIVIPATATALVGSYTVTVGASNERGTAGNQSFGLTMPVPPSAGLYTFTTVTFTSGTASGQYGPDITQARNGLINGNPTPSAWYNTYLNMTTSGIQRWTVPATGSYTIEVWGARGGNEPGNNWIGGYGARMRGIFSLTQGDVLKIMIGQSGGQSYGGGGGMTAVATSSDSPLIVAGGGNSTSPWSGTVVHATTSTSGVNGSYGGAGSNGNGGSATAGVWGGAGFYGNPTGNPNCGGNIPQSFTNGGAGGNHCNSIGGFGGGSATDGCCYGASGAGGGYSGGSGTSSSSQYGGAGGSYNGGSNQSNDNGGTGSATRSWPNSGQCIMTKI